MMKHAVVLRRAAGALLMAVLWLGAGSPVPAQGFNDIRSYLEVRDAAAAVKAELELAVTSATGSVLLANPKAEQEVTEILSWLDERAKNFGRQQTPLSVYYSDRLSRILAECRALYPHFVKRRALALSTGGGRVPSPQLPEMEQPQDVNAAVIVGQTPAPAPKPSSAIMPNVSASPASRKTEVAAARIQRRTYFYPIGVRTLLPMGELKPAVPVTVPAAIPVAIPVVVSATMPVSIASAAAPVVAPASFPQLPGPVAQAPAAFTPLEPWNGPDPQVRQVPGMRPLAIMIENHNQARPQTAMHEAEVVYEIPVEGGITRFMALYYHVPNIVGPVRSCREYFVDRALEVNALYVHCGGSPNGYKYLGDQKVFAIDEISNGTPFFRDNIRKAPHNLYTKPQKLIDVMNRKYPMQLPYQKLPFLYGPVPTAGSIACRGLSIRYHGNYTASYKMNPRSGRYDRYMNGTQQLDRVSLQPVSPGTVFLQMANMRVIDDKGRQEISFIGEGRGLVLYGGTARQVIWKKTAPREFTRIYDEAGRPFVFSNQSPIWVQVVSPINRVAFDPPMPPAVMAFLGVNPPAAATTAKKSGKPASSASAAHIQATSTAALVLPAAASQSGSL
ncbi:MAG TPA: DUF3048 domain-containing protein [Candidatus Ozemobacteraceae bacterium]|nr:DUF3048 domain-containing protein [Candidatus Ozemobacteraceae bacterium]